MGLTVTIDMQSGAFDTYLVLVDPQGYWAAYNDDTATTNSRIVFRLGLPGTWTVAAASALPYQTGSYLLSMSCVDTGSPNLLPVKPRDWSDRIVVSKVRDTYIDSTPPILPTDTVYISWAIQNDGRAQVPASPTWYTELLIDGVVKTGGQNGGYALSSGNYLYWHHYSTTLPAGTHTLRLRADSTGVVPESNESDNEYTRTVVIAASQSPPGVCTPTARNLCLNAARFKVEVAWRSQTSSGIGTAVPMSNDTGNFWFFSSTNTELVVKVLDGRAINGRFWVFYGALSDVEYTITVTDVISGAVKTYVNPQGRLASTADTSAF